MFLNPFMLLGMSAVSVPIIIHLLNKRRFERVVWAAMRFLRVSVDQNQRRIRIEDLILLILRCLLIALLALALARPVLRAASGWLGREPVVAVIVLDNSYSMSATDGVKSRFDLAKDAATQIIDKLPTGSSTALILASDVSNRVIPEPTFGLKFARETVQQAELGDRSTNLLPAIRDAVETLQGHKALRREIYVITDGQSAGFAQLNQIRDKLDEVRKDIHANILLVGDELERNVGVSDLRSGGDLIALNQPHRFDIRLTNYGKQPAPQFTVSLSIDDEQPLADQVIESIPQGESRLVSLFATFRAGGYHTVTAAVSADHLPADDKRTIAVQVQEAVRALLVDGDPQRAVRDSETFALREALQPVPREERDAYFVRVTTIDPARLDDARLDEFQVIALANVTDLSPAAAAAIEQAVRKEGRGLIIFLGEKTNTRFYNEELFAKRKLLPASLGEAYGDPKQDEKFFVLEGKNLEHSITSLWNDPNKGRLTTARFFRAIVLVPAKAEKDQSKLSPDRRNGEPHAILSFSMAPGNGALAGQPAAIEHAAGLGRVVMFASTADTAWNDLPMQVHVWVPLVKRTLASLVERADDRLNVKVGQRLVRQFTNDNVGRNAIIARPRMRKDDPRDQRTIEMHEGTAMVEYDRTELAGAYEIGVSGAAPVRFAAQSDPEESRPGRVGAAGLEALRPMATIVEWKPGMVLGEALQKERMGTELWLPLAILALLLAASETFLAHWFSKPK